MDQILRYILFFSTIALIPLTIGCAKENKELLPVVTTNEISNITETTAISGGTITSDGGKSVISRGVCWSIDPTPTIISEKTIDGAGGGKFTSSITGLFGGTNYFLRAYATNEAGTGYGMALAFTTTGAPPSAPLAETGYATNLQSNSATLNGIVNARYYSTNVSFDYGTTNSYGSTLTATQSPIKGNNDISVSADITGLIEATTYHFRVKAVNSLGTSYGDDATFRTYKQTRTYGVDTINTTLHGLGPYYALGFSFSLSHQVSTLEDPGPDMTLLADVDIDGTIKRLMLQADNFQNSFYNYGEYSSASLAESAYKGLTSATVSQWSELADVVKANQVWIFRTASEHYAKFRVISTISEVRNGTAFGECVFEWSYQPDGSLTFTGK